MRPADADNDVTFGADASSDGSKAASNSGRDPADGARKPAWANAGAGVAVVSGRQGPLCTCLPLNGPTSTQDLLLVHQHGLLQKSTSDPVKRPSLTLKRGIAWLPANAAGRGIVCCGQVAPGEVPARSELAVTKCWMCRGASWEPPGKVRTAPVAVVDPRKEHNKLRLQMTGGAMLKGKDRSSPSSYGTPKGLRSPLSSPLVGDSIQVSLL